MSTHSASHTNEDREAGPAEPGREEWREVDRRLREYARHRASLDAAEAFDLLRAEQLKLHFLHGFVSMYEYMERVLGYGPHAARERMRVARTLAKLPQTTAALSRGELTYSAVRELTRVATAETEASWLAATEGMAANQIEGLVAGHQPGDQPEDPTHPDRRDLRADVRSGLGYSDPGTSRDHASHLGRCTGWLHVRWPSRPNLLEGVVVLDRISATRLPM
jgi:hypothetical protein